MDADRAKMIGYAAALVLLAVLMVVVVWQERIKRRRHEAFVRWQESEAGKDFRWVDSTKDDNGGGSWEA
jgi:hypothetical protein